MTNAPVALAGVGIDRERLARWIGWSGVALGSLAFFVTLPPITARSPIVPIVIGGLGVVAGAAALREGAGRRLATLAMAAGALGIFLGWLCTRSSVESLDQVFVWSALIAATLRAATPLTFAALGGLISERSGVVNIGLEGMMLMGAFFGFLAADKLGSWGYGILFGVLAGAALALVHAFISIHLRADQIVSGFAVNFLALGLTGYFFIEVYTDQGTPGEVSNIPTISIPGLRDLDFVGDAIGRMHLLIWVALIFVVVTHLLLFRTPAGLRLRAVGEHPKAADTLGISVYAVRYTAVVISGALAAPRRCLPLQRDHALVQREPLRRARIHRARRRHLRPLASVRRARRVPPLRLHGGARAAPAQRLRRGRRLDDALPRAALRRDARRRRRRRRALDPAGRGRPSLRQAVGWRRAGRATRADRCWPGLRRSRRCRWRSS